MVNRSCVLLAATACAWLCGCDDPYAPVTRTTIRTDSSQKNNTFRLEPGLYFEGPKHDFVQDTLSGANAKIWLNDDQCIEWYDPTKRAWSTIDNIEEIKPVLASIQPKILVTIMRGKAYQDHDGYTSQIIEYANELGFATTVVSDASGEGLHVSKVIQQGN